MRKLLLLLLFIVCLLPGCSISNANRQATSQSTTPKPIIIEKDFPDLREELSLVFQLSMGSSVEGEITVTVTDRNGKVLITSTDPVISTLLDSYGNIIFRSAVKQSTETGYDHWGQYYNNTWAWSNQKYPWGFAFLPASTGEYTLKVWTPFVPDSYVSGGAFGGTQIEQDSMRDIVSVHLKFTVYPQ